MFYAVAKGRTTGIFNTWQECCASINEFPHAKFQKFSSQEEAECFIQTYSMDSTTKQSFRPIEPEMTRWKFSSDEFVPDYYVYTDGACSNNGRKNASAGIGVFFGINDPRNISRPVLGKQTNNTAELLAFIAAYDVIRDDIGLGKKIAMVTDSEYAIKCLTTYGDRCSKKQWRVDIPNKDLVKNVYELYKGTKNVEFVHIEAHTENTDIHSFGNANADKLAKQACERS